MSLVPYVVEQTSRGERSYDIYSRLLKDRIIFSTDKDLRFYLMNYIEKKGIMDPKALNQWKFIPEEWTVPAAKHDYEYLFGVVNK